MNFKKYSVLFLLGITTVAAVFFFYKTKSLKLQLNQIEEQQSNLTEELHDYEELVHIDSMLLKGDYDTALSSYNETLKIHHENKMGIPVRIALAEKLLHVEAAGNKAKKEIEKDTDSLAISLIATSQEIRKMDSLNFTLEKTKVQLARLRGLLKKKSFGEYLQFKSLKGNQMHYVGEVKNGKANGYGIALLDTGSRYEGEWKNNRRHGEGTFYWSDGQYYVGTYNSDKRNGFGTYYWPNGEKYEGEWQDDKRSGEGQFFGTDGAIVTGGQWQDDKLVEATKRGSR
ncbi:hypothetical protein FEE95_12510 [Maribacter algarum]|uniref:MORN repeat-containing protein n=1 Tax=Maribacter algarum (ex Zhang et al. 2020) TaxID=2578118 RepID=A0A5S3PRL2_9FLAO|nr:hypothetical protein [Maribacter algarum]TMM57301.1 hypothetical protein FEE95_12510 [Maribacter algarum]